MKNGMSLNGIKRYLKPVSTKQMEKKLKRIEKELKRIEKEESEEAKKRWIERTKKWKEEDMKRKLNSRNPVEKVICDDCDFFAAKKDDNSWVVFHNEYDDKIKKISDMDNIYFRPRGVIKKINDIYILTDLKDKIEDKLGSLEVEVSDIDRHHIFKRSKKLKVSSIERALRYLTAALS